MVEVRNDLLFVNGILDRALKTVRARTNSQNVNQNNMADALSVLNELLCEFNGTGQVLPFQIMQTFTLKAGKGVYTIGELDGASDVTTPFADIDYIAVLLSGVRYPIEIQSDFAILGNAISLTNQGRPGWVRINRSEYAVTLEFFAIPDQDYECEIWGKKQIYNVAMGDYIQLPGWYARYLRLALARELNSFFKTASWDKNDEAHYQEARTFALASAKKDWAVKTQPPFSTGLMISNYLLGVRY